MVERFLDARRELQRVVALRLDRRRRNAQDVLLLGADVEILTDAEHELAHDLPEAVEHLLGLFLVEPLRLQARGAEESVERRRRRGGRRGRRRDGRRGRRRLGFRRTLRDSRGGAALSGVPRAAR